MLADMNSVNKNDCRELEVSCCCILDVFGHPRVGGYKWQYILVAAFSSLLSYYFSTAL